MRARMSSYKGPPEALFREKQREKDKEIKNSTFRVTLFRLKKQGLIERNDFWWRITEKGRRYLQKKLTQVFPSHSKLDNPKRLKAKNMIVMFDIPEKLHRKRDWLRDELRQLRFEMMQKSVWFGPSPLPKDFVKNVQDMNILCYIKFFRANEADIV